MNLVPTVFVVDDDLAILAYFAELVSSLGLKSRTFSSGIDYLNQFDPHVPGVLLLDLRMPDVSGLALQERLTKQPICPPIIILSGYADVPVAIRALKLGAFDFLQKTVCQSELREAIQRAITHDANVRREHAKRTEACKLLSSLSASEREVLDLILVGLPNKAIASKLAVSQRAVEDRRSRLSRKLKVDSLPSLVRFATDVGLRPTE